MAKNWYPVIDYLACTECGTCVDFCSHSVYNKAKAPSPVVMQPGNCIDRCHGCGNKCPAGAISYVGDDTGWTPPNGECSAEKNGDCCRGGACEEDSSKAVLVEYLYLDLNTCDRCIGADAVLEEVLGSIAPALETAGYTMRLQKVQIATKELAEHYRFLASPTIRVNGQDICGPVAENICGCCGEISGTDVTCRTFAYKGQAYEVPPKAMLAEGILRTVLGMVQPVCDCGEYSLPENLKNFFEGKAVKTGCCSGGTCG